MSIKNAERSRRAESGVQKVRIVNPDQTVPKQWKQFLSYTCLALWKHHVNLLLQFLSCGENKESLIKFLCQHWKIYKSSRLHGVSTIYITAEEECHVFYSSECRDAPVVCSVCPELESNNEEADTRMVLHGKHASNFYDTVIIRSSDSDVLIFFLAMMHNFRSKDIFLIACTGSNVRVIHLNKIYNAMSEEVRLCLLGFHAFTGILNNKFIGLQFST